jgi:hypothetical protein
VGIKTTTIPAELSVNGALYVSGAVTGGTFYGDASGLTNFPATFTNGGLAQILLNGNDAGRYGVTNLGGLMFSRSNAVSGSFSSDVLIGIDSTNGGDTNLISVSSAQNAASDRGAYLQLAGNERPGGSYAMLVSGAGPGNYVYISDGYGSNVFAVQPSGVAFTGNAVPTYNGNAMRTNVFVPKPTNATTAGWVLSTDNNWTNTYAVAQSAGGGGSTLGTFSNVGFSVVCSYAQAIPASTYTRISNNIVVEDGMGAWDSSQLAYRFPSTGMWAVVSFGQFDPVTTYQTTDLRIRHFGQGFTNDFDAEYYSLTAANYESDSPLGVRRIEIHATNEYAALELYVNGGGAVLNGTATGSLACTGMSGWRVK